MYLVSCPQQEQYIVMTDFLAMKIDWSTLMTSLIGAAVLGAVSGFLTLTNNVVVNEAEIKGLKTNMQRLENQNNNLIKQQNTTNDLLQQIIRNQGRH